MAGTKSQDSGLASWHADDADLTDAHRSLTAKGAVTQRDTEASQSSTEVLFSVELCDASVTSLCKNRLFIGY